MKIEKKLNGNGMTICLQGSLDSMTAPELKEALNEMPDSVESLVFDFKNLDYVTSAGIRVLLKTYYTLAKKGGMKIVNANEEITDILNITGMTELLNTGKA